MQNTVCIIPHASKICTIISYHLTFETDFFALPSSTVRVRAAKRKEHRVSPCRAQRCNNQEQNSLTNKARINKNRIKRMSTVNIVKRNIPHCFLMEMPVRSLTFLNCCLQKNVRAHKIHTLLPMLQYIYENNKS